MAEVEDSEEVVGSDRLREVHTRALKRFDLCAEPQAEIRAHALQCRRFISVPGAMWEGPWGEEFENSIKVEIDKLSKGVEKIIQDYRANRIEPDFRPSGGDSDADTADTLDGMYRADAYHYKAQQALDNAFEEAVSGGFGAYRLANDYADPYDTDADEQRVNPGLMIADADQRVYFDPNAKLYDKSDAKFAFVLTADAREAFEEEYPGKAVEWPEDRLAQIIYDWFTPDVVVKAEYYEIEEKKDELLIFTHKLSEEEQRHWADEMEPGEAAELKASGWKRQSKMRLRRRVCKYVLSGAEVLEDCGYIAGDQIPIVPVYGKRWFVDNQERFRGHISKRMDAQRIYNAKISKLAEIDALAPREKPIFDPEQLPPPLQTLWAEQEQKRHPYALALALRNPDGTIASLGPVGKVEPPQLQPVTAALLQIAASDLTEETEDGADEVVANTSVEAMNVATTRIDAKSGIYLDNMRQSVQRGGEIYLAMCKEVYFEAGRTVETMSADGEDGEATLSEAYTNPQGKYGTRNDFSSGKYKVIVDVSETTATRRDKTVRSMLATAQIAVTAQDMSLAQIAILTAIMNQDGEGMKDLQTYARKQLVAAGVVQPNDDEKAEMEQAQEQQQQSPEAQVLAAKAADMAAAAEFKQAKAGEAKASTVLKIAQANELGGPVDQPDVPDGLDDADRAAKVHKTLAETRAIETATAHMPQKLAIEGANAVTNRIKAHKGAQGRAS